MFKCSVKVDQKMQTELNESIWLKSLISLIIGSVGLGAYIIFGTFFDNFWMNLLLWVSAFLFGFGLVLLLSIKKTNKKSIERNLVDHIELNEEFLIEQSDAKGEIISTNKVYYKDITKIRETENYLFLYVNKVSVVPIFKGALKPEELSTVKLWINSAKINNNN